MYFLSRSNKYYAWMMGTRSIYRYSALFSFLLSIGLIWFFLMYVPLSNSLHYYSDQLIVINMQRAAFEKVKNSYKHTVRAVTQLEITYNRLIKAHIADVRIESLVPFNCSVQSGANLHSYAQIKGKDIEWGKKYITSLSLSALFLEQLVQFVALMHCATGVYMAHSFTITSGLEKSFVLQANFKNIVMEKGIKKPFNL